MLAFYIPPGYYIDIVHVGRRTARAAAEREAEADREGGLMALDVEMLTVGPVAENCFLSAARAPTGR